MRDRGFTLWRRAVKRQKRTKKDFNQHYNFLTCACYTDRKIQNMLADTPVRSASWRHERNERSSHPYRDDNSWLSLTVQELRAQGQRKNVYYDSEN